MGSGVNESGGFLGINPAAMTTNDWAGLIITVVVFLLMIGAYWYVFNPRNKERLEKQRYLPDDEDVDESSEEKK